MKKLFLILALLICPSAQAVLTIGNHTAVEVTGSTARAPAISVTAGQVVVVACLTAFSGGCSTPSDTLGITNWHAITFAACACTVYAQGFGYRANAFWGRAANSGQETVTASAVNSGDFNLLVTAINGTVGLDPSLALDKATNGGANPNSTATDGITSTATATTASANEIIVGCAIQNSGAPVSGTGFTQLNQTAVTVCEYENVSATGAYAATFTATHTDGSEAIVMTFQETVPAYNGTANFDGNFKFAGPLKVTGGSDPTLNYSTHSLAWGSRIETVVEDPQVITLTNVGSSTITFTSFVITGSTDYTQTNTCGASIAAGNNCTVSLTFAPTTVGADNGTLTISDSSPGSPQTVSLSGTGVSSTAILFTDNFSTGDFSNWSTSSGFSSDNPFIENTVTYGGDAHSYGQQFQWACCTPGDSNRWIAKILTGVNEVWVRGKVYVKSPEVDATPVSATSYQRKLLEFGDSNSGSNCCGSWAPILNSWTTPSAQSPALQWEEQPCGSTGDVYYNIGTFSFNAWHTVEVHMLLDQGGAGGSKNGVVDVWLDGTQTFHSAAEFIRGTCTDNFTGYFVGRQVDTPANTTIDEFRYWGRIVVATAYIGP